METQAGGDTGDPWRDKMRVIREMEDDWQQEKSAVSDLETSADELNRIVRALLPNAGRLPARFAALQKRPSADHLSGGAVCVLEAIAAHPNAPPELLLEILETAPPAARAFCQNPITSLLLLELPYFPLKLSRDGRLALLREETAPPAFVSMIAGEPAPEFAYEAAQAETVRVAARLHVCFDSNQTADWQTNVREYWQQECVRANQAEAEWYADLAEIGLAPSWTALNAAAPTSKRTDYPFLNEWFRYAPPTTANTLHEAALLQQIGPSVSDKRLLSRALGANGSANDLILLANVVPDKRGLVLQAIFQHPRTNADVLRALGARNYLVEQLLLHPEMDAGYLRELLLNHSTPNVRRLARRHKNAPSEAVEISRRSYEDRARNGNETYYPPFASFVTSLYFGNLYPRNALIKKVESLQWTERMEAVFIAAQNPDALRGDYAGRTCADLLTHLSRDGNRLVRAAARAYLSDPHLVFEM